MNTEIRSPNTPQEWESYYHLRYEVLRKPLNQPQGSERNEGDLSGIHFALFHETVIQAIARLDKVDNSICQVRFVAVDDKLQGKGFGAKIMEAVEKHAVEMGYKKLILHARDNALMFYERIGYTTLEKSHLLYGQVQHYLMEKELV